MIYLSYYPKVLKSRNLSCFPLCHNIESCLAHDMCTVEAGGNGKVRPWNTLGRVVDKLGDFWGHFSVELYYLLCKMRRLEQMIFKILQFFHGFLHLFLWIFKPWGLKEWAMPKKSKARATGLLAFMIGPRRIFLGHFFTPASVDRLCLILAEGEWKTTLIGSESREWGLRFNLMRLASVARSQRTQRSRWQTQIT